MLITQPNSCDEFIYMKTKIIYLIYSLFYSLLVTQADASVTMSGSRVIFPGDSSSKTIQFNNQDNEPAIIQLQMVKADGSLENDSPFIMVPPAFRIEPHSDQSVRIIHSGKILSTNKESLFYLQFKQLPSIKKSDTNGNKLLITINNNVKVFYRPKSLMENENSNPASKIKFDITHSSLTLRNPTGYFIPIIKLEIQGEDKSYKFIQYKMLAPFSSLTQSLYESLASITNPKIKLSILNDSGAKRDLRL